jgi:hypothetical protein
MGNEPIPGTKNNQQLTNDIIILRKQYEGLMIQYETLKKEVDSKPKLSDLTRLEANLQKMISDNAADITKLERQLATVILPDTPRTYLTQDEVTSFQANTAKLLAMMTSFEQLYRNLVSYSSNT